MGVSVICARKQGGVAHARSPQNGRFGKKDIQKTSGSPGFLIDRYKWIYISDVNNNNKIL